LIHFSIITLFPEFFSGPLLTGQVARGLKQGLFTLDLVALREFAEDKYGTVDDRVYGGGSGMVLQCGPLVRALEWVEARQSVREAETGVSELSEVLVMSAAGMQWSQEGVEETMAVAKEAAAKNLRKHLILICGRYEGVDQRFCDFYATREVCIGPYVLNGGEAASWVVVESLVRFIPGIVGKEDSLRFDSFSKVEGTSERRLDSPHYTTPAEFRGLRVPGVLRSGHHAHVKSWRQEQSAKRTAFIAMRQSPR
jgi:tRNA (guanine37-N1)-methyltransferase